MLKLSNGYQYEEGMSLETFMAANKLTAYSVAKGAFKDAKAAYGKHVRADIKASPDAVITNGKENASFNRKDNRWEITATVTSRYAAVEGNTLHENAVKRALQKSAERHAKFESDAMAFREACRKSWEADKAKREADAAAKAEQEAKDKEIANKLAAEMANG
jgi:hypothetical protein